ncbi:MAG: YtxH domain-containing protein [Candidatus Handelsmanbacteria bacterium]|nr:YtxH domain-containing protein [Candidatus Handelsmanbacteria bacterium]
MGYQLRNSADSDTEQVLSFLAGCLAGLAIGGALGLLLAPHRGDITRRKLSRRAGETRDQAIQAVEELMERREKGKRDGDEAANS